MDLRQINFLCKFLYKKLDDLHLLSSFIQGRIQPSPYALVPMSDANGPPVQPSFGSSRTISLWALDHISTTGRVYQPLHRVPTVTNSGIDDLISLFSLLWLVQKPHIAYLLRLLMDLSVTYFNIVRGIKNQRPRQPVPSTLLAQIKCARRTNQDKQFTYILILHTGKDVRG